MNKAKLIQKKIEEGKLSVNEARLLLDLEPIEVLMKVACEQSTNVMLKDSKQMNVVKDENEPLLQIVLSDIDSAPVVHYKGKQIDRKLRVAFDWKTKSVDKIDMTYIHIEHVPVDNKRLNTEIIQYNYPIVGGSLPKFSTKELIESLKLKEDVQITETGEDAYKVSLDLLKVKKHVLVINNCNPKIIEHAK